MINYSLASLFQQSSDKQWTFTSDNHTLTNNEFVGESLELQESMCETTEFQVGTYSSSRLKIQILRTALEERLVGERFAVSLVLNGHTENPFNFCDYTVVSDKITSDHRARELVMYDDLYKFTQIDVHTWYNEFIPENGSKTVKEIRDGLFAHLAELDEPIEIEQENIELVNDSIPVYKTTNLSSMLASDLLKCILHINACNGMINRQGKFRYIYIPQKNPTVDVTIPALQYHNCHFEEYEVASFNDIRIAETASKRGANWTGVIGNGSAIKISGNFFLYKAEFSVINATLNGVKSVLQYSFNFTPFELERRGNPCIECGDVIEVTTDIKTFKSIIVSRTLKGFIGLVDEYKTDSDEYINQELDLGNISDTTIGYIGDSAISNDEGGESYIDQANCAWKLRSYPVDEETEERYYTYLTKNKHLIVSNDEVGGHSAENDKTSDCTIGSKNYPWKAGYFNELYVGDGSSSRTVQDAFVEMIRNIGFRLLAEPTDVSVVWDPLYEVVSIEWTDPDDITTSEPIPATWAGTVVVRHDSSDILHRWDGELVVDSSVHNQYAIEPFVDEYEDFEVGETYYYGIFPYDENGCYRFTKIVDVTITPMPIPEITSLRADHTDAIMQYSVPTQYEWSEIGVVYKKNSPPETRNDGKKVDITNGDGEVTIRGLADETLYYFKIYSTEQTTGKQFLSDAKFISTGKALLGGFVEVVEITKGGTEVFDYEEIITITQV